MLQKFDFSLPIQQSSVKYLTEIQLNLLTQNFYSFYYSKEKKIKKKNRGRYWLTFLTLKYTGARLGEVLNINDATDIYFMQNEIKIITLKRKKQKNYRIVPVPPNLISEIAIYLAEYPDMKGQIFKLDQGNFRRVFYKICEKSGIPKDLSHPHVLRHTRAIELLRAGVPITVVQDLLGHAFLTTTAIYLRISNSEAKEILKIKGFI